MTRQLAIARGIGFGNRDVGRPVPWFSAYISESGAALQVIDGATALKVIQETGVTDVKNLEGRACWVEVGNGLIKFLEFAKI